MNHEAPNFDQIYSEYGDRIYRFAYRLTGNEADAQDIAQETFLAAMTGWSQFRGESQPSTWIYQICLRKARRMRLRKALSPLRVLRSTKIPSVQEQIEVMEAVEKLCPAFREAFVLVRVEGFTALEAARIVQVPEGTMKFRVFRAVKQLRSELSDSSEVAKELSHEL